MHSLNPIPDPVTHSVPFSDKSNIYSVSHSNHSTSHSPIASPFTHSLTNPTQLNHPSNYPPSINPFTHFNNHSVTPLVAVKPSITSSTQQPPKHLFSHPLAHIINYPTNYIFELLPICHYPVTHPIPLAAPRHGGSNANHQLVTDPIIQTSSPLLYKSSA